MRVVFISSNFTWGGSEILWSETAAELARRGHDVRAYKNRLHPRDGNVSEMRSAGVRMIELASFPWLPNRLYSLLAKFVPQVSAVYQAVRLHISLKLRKRPDLVVISQGGNHDGWYLTAVCRRLKLPFVQVCQKATDLYWPQDRWLKTVRANYESALHSYFVAGHNLRLTEEQLGRRLDRASVVRNPYNVPHDAQPAWPAESAELRIACIGRLYPKEKGQDILLRVLARDEWRERPVSVTFFGTGEQKDGLEAMAGFLGLANVRFAGHEEDIVSVWAGHHLLALPSRAEGLPLVLVEAMLCGRPALVTDVAGNAELIEDMVTGFVADAATEKSVGEALERAWQGRSELQAMGEAAAARARKAVPVDPPAVFAEALLGVAAEAQRPVRAVGSLRLRSKAV
jgi:glycosyltransferase involved in cell wall biosynthesis